MNPHGPNPVFHGLSQGTVNFEGKGLFPERARFAKTNLMLEMAGQNHRLF